LERNEKERGTQRINQERSAAAAILPKPIIESVGNGEIADASAISPDMLMGWKPKKAHFFACCQANFFRPLDSRHWVAILEFHAAKRKNKEYL